MSMTSRTWSWMTLPLSRTSTGMTRLRTMCSPLSLPPTPPSHSPSPSGASGQGETPLPVWTLSPWSGTMTMTSVVTWSPPCPELCPLRMKRARKTKISTSEELLAYQVGKSSCCMPACEKRKGNGCCPGNISAQQPLLPSPVRGDCTEGNSWTVT